MSRQASAFLSRFLDDLGYSHEMVNFRRRSNTPVTIEVLNNTFSAIKCGSKGEGLTLPLENDIDQMVVIMSMECHDMCDLSNRNNGHLTTFKLERLNTTAPGYALLKCVTLDQPFLFDWVREFLVELDGSFFLSSVNWKENMKDALNLVNPVLGYDLLQTLCRETQGPSCPSVCINGVTSMDNVYAIRCFCSRYTTTWKDRRRLHEWPSPELIDKVSSLEAHVVPIGYKASPLHSLEWRICFTKAELCLIGSLNDCQTKLIILLKMIAKHALKPVCKEMTSYVMKNLVLWIAETNPRKEFVEHNLLTLLMHALKVLKSCIRNKKLPSYMIEERNLFADRISDKHRRNVCIKIDILLHEGPKMLLRCPKIQNGLNTFQVSPDQFYIISYRRRCLESAFIVLGMRQTEHFQRMVNINPVFTADTYIGGLFSHDSLWHILPIVIQTVFSDWLELLAKGENIFQVLFERLMYYLS